MYPAGLPKAEAAICTAMEDLAVLLQYACTLVKGDDLDSLNMTARQIEGLAERIGMVKLSRVAVDVYLLCGRDDKPALHATVSRMRRVGEQSLIAIWDREDLSI